MEPIGIKFTLDTYLAIAGLVFGLLSMILALLIYHFDLKRTLAKIQENQEGTLTREQAHDLVALYVDAVNLHLSKAVEHYASYDMKDHYRTENLQAIKLSLHDTYDAVVTKSKRAMVAKFRLRGGYRFNEIISSVSRERIVSAYKEIEEIIVEGLKIKKPLDEVMPAILSAIRRANASGSAAIIESINQLYRKSSD